MTMPQDNDSEEAIPQLSEDQPDYDPLDRPPVEVFRAVEGECKQLADYLRRGRPPSYYTIDAIAAWMAGELPPTRPPGNPYGGAMRRVGRAVGLKLAEFVYKKRFEHAGRPPGKSNEIADEVATERGLDPETFHNYRRRSKKQKEMKRLPEMSDMERMWWEWKDQQ
ncbi:hypothetical protein N8I71_17620 [Roseibacterium sp. SDUM158016]|uniref:hypothetical protein n=1 Tax=Roseicyclus sediminis TaxID=2980997 RepID=UPI0021CFBAC0|nr:hypothetical protein [Roseibacterium sp. SDUM158016]MCU4654663.1 hypothetical protein [Roseibacterium sp. SDUM158016]